MKELLFLLVLSSASAFAADPALQQFSVAKTNGDVVLTLDVFTRAGETNLIRSTVMSSGILESRTHKFYQDGVLVGEHWSFPDSSGFITEAYSPYTLIFQYSPSNSFTAACICTDDRIVIQCFTATNGLFYPVDGSSASESRRMSTETQKSTAPASR